MKETVFYDKWLNRMTTLMTLKFPNRDKKEISKIVDQVASEQIEDKKITIHNNYSDRDVKMKLSDLYDWILENKPVLTESGVMFKNQDQSPNPAAGMLRAQRDSRDANKKEMYKYDYDSDEFHKYNILQMDDKVDSNSYYGASGAPSSIFYNLAIATSTTVKGRNLITTAAMSFENFLANNVLFASFDECLEYMLNIREEKYPSRIVDEDFIKSTNRDRTFKLLINKFEQSPSDEIKSHIKDILSKMQDKTVAKIYYKNNLYKYVTQTKLGRSIMTAITSGMKDIEFKNPEEPPKEINDDMENLWSVLKHTVFYNYVIPDRFERISEKMIRQSVVVVDTDSNMLNMTKWLLTIMENFDLEKEKRVGIVNICAFLSTKMIREHLNLYCESCNVLPRYYSVIDMKNEYLYKRMLLTMVKKRYAGLLERKEEKILDPMELDMKGLAIRKSETNDFATNKFTDILIDDILKPDDLDPMVVLDKMSDFEKAIKDKLLNGDLDVLKPISVKPPEAYKNPFRMQGLRAVIAWNFLYPHRQIELPSKCYLVKLNMTTKQELEELKKKFPEQGAIVEEKIFGNPNEDLAKHGLNVIAIPKTFNSIPEWLREFIDFNTIIQNNAKAFNNPIKSLGFLPIHTKGNNETYSNIISF